MVLALAATCTPLKSARNNPKAGQFEVSKSSLYERSGDFSLLDQVVYPKQEEKTFPTAINVPDKFLTIGDATHYGRCNRCHECGFEEAFDLEHYQTPDWKPRYIGDEWKAVVQRMRDMDNSLINEKIADRLFGFLHDATLGTYDPTKDTGPQTVVDINPTSRTNPGIPVGPTN